MALPSLRGLDISNTSVTDAGLEKYLTRRTGLEVLCLSSTTVTDAVVPNLVKQTRLRCLDLSQCKGITDASVKGLSKLGQLDFLNVSYSGITLDGLRKLRKALSRSRLQPGPDGVPVADARQPLG